MNNSRSIHGNSRSVADDNNNPFHVSKNVKQTYNEQLKSIMKMKRKFTMMILAMLLMSIGTHAATLNNPTAAEIKACDEETLIVTGTLSAEAIAALQELNSNVKNVLLNQATIDDTSAEFVFKSTTVENIVLPKDLPAVKDTWFSECSSLNAALSYSSDAKSMKAYVNKAGTLATTMGKLQLNSTVTDLGTSYDAGNTKFADCTIEEVVLSGNINSKELAKNGGGNALNGCYIKHYDLSNATLSSPSDLISAGQDNWAAQINGVIALEQIELPLNITSIPDNCFQGCGNLKQIYLPSTITNIGSNAFNQCTSLETVEFGKGFKSLSFSNNVFNGSTALKHVVFPEGLENIGDDMFFNCKNLESIRLPNSLKHIGKNAFKFCEGLTYLTIPAGVETIGSGAFDGSGIKDVYLMAETVDQLPYIASDAFNSRNFDGNNSLWVGSASSFETFTKRLIKLIERGEVTGVTKEEVESWQEQLGKNYKVSDMPDKKIIELLPTEEVEELYREFVGSGNTIAYIHYPRLGEDNEPTELSYFIDGNPWKDTDGYYTSDLGGGFYGSGRLNDDGSDAGRAIRTDKENERSKTKDFLSDVYGIGPDAAGRYWPDNQHDDLAMRTKFADPNDPINANDTWKETATITSGEYAGFSKYYWRKFLLQAGFNKNNDEVYTMWMDDTWYTMCFPFDLTDEQLEAAFQSNRFNIAEFSGAAIYPETKQNSKGEDVEVNNLVLCFTTIAYTWYKDKYDKYYYRTRDNDTNRTKHYWKAQRKWTEDASKGVSDWYLTTETGAIMNDTNKGAEVTNSGDDKDIYQSIDGILALAGHPYMIHPYRVEDNNGAKTLCTIPKVVYKHSYNRRGSMNATKLKETMDAIEKLYNDEAVTRPLSTIPSENKFTETDDFFSSDKDGITDNHGVPYSPGRYGDLTATTIGNYTFKGSYLPRKYEEVVTGEKTEELIPYGAYFLGVETGKKYPKFWREISKNTSRTSGYWRQYTAIIQPDEAAAAWEKENLYQDKSVPGTTSNAKGLGMLFSSFDDVEETTPDAIEEIVAEAEEKGQTVERMNIIVNINGQVVRQGTDVQGLPSGIYIVNGKKYLVK